MTTALRVFCKHYAFCVFYKLRFYTVSPVVRYLYFWVIIISNPRNMKPNVTATTIADEQLIVSIREGDRAAFGILYNRYYKKVYYKCLSFTKDRDAAYDYAQESLIKAFDHLDTFRGHSSFSTWLYSITQHHCLAGLKKSNRISTTALTEQFIYSDSKHSATSIDESSQRNEQETIMYKLIDHLPENEKQLLTLKYQQGESIEELQEKLGLNPSTVKMRLKRSKEKLNALYMLALTYGIEHVLEVIELL
jgi:RNA polymerase sigma factor (sigma-70 family)